MAILNVLGSFASCVVSRFWDQLLLHIGYPLRIKGNVKQMCDLMKRLEARRDDIKAEIADARKERRACKSEVKDWLQSVQEIESEVKAIKDDYDKRSRCFGECSLNVSSSYVISSRAANQFLEIKDLYERGNFGKLLLEPSPTSVFAEKQIPMNVFGMEANLLKIIDYITDDQVSIIGIWGMGGVGKTTLLKIVNNYYFDCFADSGFHHVIYVVVSRGSNHTFDRLRKLQTEVAESLRLFLDQHSSLESRASIIYNFLKDKSFLLLLDDLWKQVDLEMIGIPQPNGQNKQKVVITTRNEGICGQMAAQTKMKVECLKPNEAWQLFRDNFGENTIEGDTRISDLAVKVAEECGGLPLALIMIGRAMSTKRTRREWENALTTLQKSYDHNSNGVECLSSNLFAKLVFSYDNLENKRMKMCFLCCAMWPEDYSIWSFELIDCWLGLGLLEMLDSLEETYSSGFALIKSLKEACLLEPGDLNFKEVKIHDIIRDMALWIVGCRQNNLQWIVQAGTWLRKISKDDIERWRGAERISLMCNYMESLPLAPDWPHLIFLTVQQNFHLKTIPDSFFQHMTSLRCLDLSWVPIKELPKSIGALCQLQYLNLTRTDIRILPEELGNLKQLKHLNLQYMLQLKKILRGVIPRLQKLQVLNLFQSKYAGIETKEFNQNSQLDKEEFNISELGCLEDGLKALGISLETTYSLSKILRFRNVYLRLLGLHKLEGETSLHLNLPSSIVVLNFQKCPSVEEIMLKVVDNHHEQNNPPRLEFLTLWQLPNLKKLNMSTLVNLRSLLILDNKSLRHVSCVIMLPFLEKLDLSFCLELEQVINDEYLDVNKEGIVHTFCRLRILLMNHLPSLACICKHKLAIPCLEYIDVFCCPLLQDLPFWLEVDSICSLKQIRGEKKWWESLKWDDEKTQAFFLSFFREFEYNLESFDPVLTTNPFFSSMKSFFTRREPMMRTAIQFSTHLQYIFGSEMP